MLYYDDSGTLSDQYEIIKKYNKVLFLLFEECVIWHGLKTDARPNNNL